MATEQGAGLSQEGFKASGVPHQMLKDSQDFLLDHLRLLTGQLGRDVVDDHDHLGQLFLLHHWLVADLQGPLAVLQARGQLTDGQIQGQKAIADALPSQGPPVAGVGVHSLQQLREEIGRASCRERV